MVNGIAQRVAVRHIAEILCVRGRIPQKVGGSHLLVHGKHVRGVSVYIYRLHLSVDNHIDKPEPSFLIRLVVYLLGTSRIEDHPQKKRYHHQCYDDENYSQNFLIFGHFVVPCLCTQILYLKVRYVYNNIKRRISQVNTLYSSNNRRLSASLRRRMKVFCDIFLQVAEILTSQNTLRLRL